MRIMKLTKKKEKPYGKWIRFECVGCGSTFECRISETIPFSTHGDDGMKNGVDYYVRCPACNNVLFEHIPLALL